MGTCEPSIWVFVHSLTSVDQYHILSTIFAEESTFKQNGLPLIREFKAGDKVTIQRLYDQLYPKLKYWVKRNSGTESDAEDLFQDAMVTTYRKLQEPEAQLNCELSTFIFAIAKKNWLQKLRRRGVHERYEMSVTQDDQVEDLEATLEEQESWELYRHYFNKLGEDCKKLLTFVFGGKTMAEIKTHFGFNNDAHARKKKFRCKEKLIEMVSKDKRYQELRK